MKEIGPFGSRMETASPITRVSVLAVAVPHCTWVNAPLDAFRRYIVARGIVADVRPIEAHRSAAVTAVV